ncbi:MAG: cytochrome oxidase maturation protein, cbb3-type [Pelagibacterium sp. SCN 63-23]|nr:MAG: cytochrome oxidase maturation protein, cbb3-type [Pelagibacterium sp. SCN 63-23]
MSDFFYLIPISIVLGLIGLVVFLWTLRNGQYEDLDGASERFLYEDDRPRPDRDVGPS